MPAMRLFALLGVVALIGWGARPAFGDVMRYVYAGPESPLDRRHEYRVAILRAALERTREGHGDYTLEQASEPMLQERQVDEMRQATGRLTVMYRSGSPEMEHDLIPVRVPVERGLTGYRVLLIRDADRAQFAAVRTLDDLRRFTFGAELWWLDDDVLKANGFRVIVGSDYEGLFRMVANGRFDALPRAVHEILNEFEARRDRVPGLAVEQSLLLRYPLPMYFWFPKTPEGERLAGRVTEGMKAMVADGTYERIFFAHYGRTIVELDLARRRVFRIDNPLLDAAAPLEDRRLWFDPTRDPVPEEALAPATAPVPKEIRSRSID